MLIYNIKLVKYITPIVKVFPILKEQILFLIYRQSRGKRFQLTVLELY